MVLLFSAEATQFDWEVCFVALLLDITERKRPEAGVRHMVNHDALTGLPNRILMLDRLNQAAAQAHRCADKMGLMFIDLDHFKHINDSLGHQVGDCLLQMAAERLEHCRRETDSVARLGGDEFVIILPSMPKRQDDAVVADKFLQELARSFIVGDHALHVSGGVGISIYPIAGRDAAGLMRAVDTAMYHAKENGRGNYQFFKPILNTMAQQRMAFVSRLHGALAQDEFVLYYQPQVNIDAGRTVAVEALLRWQPKGRDALSCSEFITVAEETGLILLIYRRAGYARSSYHHILSNFERFPASPPFEQDRS